MKAAIALVVTLLSSVVTIAGQPLILPPKRPTQKCSIGQAPIKTSPMDTEWCLKHPCVVTNDAVLREAQSSSCQAVHCSAQASDDQGEQGAPTLEGGKGTCELSTGSQTTYFCSENDKLVVTVDEQGYMTFESVGDKMPSAYFGSEFEHRDCFQPAFFGQSPVINDKLYILCTHREEEVCPRV